MGFMDWTIVIVVALLVVLGIRREIRRGSLGCSACGSASSCGVSRTGLGSCRIAEASLERIERSLDETDE